jgi:hypothetical protein
MQKNRLLFSSPLGQVSSMAAMRSDIFLLPTTGIWNNFSAFWKFVSWCEVTRRFLMSSYAIAVGGYSTRLATILRDSCGRAATT